MKLFGLPSKKQIKQEHEQRMTEFEARMDELRRDHEERMRNIDKAIEENRRALDEVQEAAMDLRDAVKNSKIHKINVS